MPRCPYQHNPSPLCALFGLVLESGVRRGGCQPFLFLDEAVQLSSVFLLKTVSGNISLFIPEFSKHTLRYQPVGLIILDQQDAQSLLFVIGQAIVDKLFFIMSMLPQGENPLQKNLISIFFKIPLRVF